MHTRQLLSFVRVADLGSFAKAAKALHATQSTIAARIRELETEWGVELFNRHNHRLQLSLKGQEILPWARQILALSDQITYQLGDADAYAGVLRVGVAGRIAHTWLPKLVAAVRERHPRLQFDLTLGLTAPLLSRLHGGELDLALVGGPIADPAVDTVSLGVDEFVWMASPSLALPSTTLDAATLSGWPIIGLSQASPHYPVIEQWFNESKVAYRPTISCNDMSMVAKLIAAGLGIGVLHRASHRAEVLVDLLQVLDTTSAFPRFEFVAAYSHQNATPLIASIAVLAAQVSEFPRDEAAFP